jgi:hydrogenase maturation protein HypF
MEFYDAAARFLKRRYSFDPRCIVYDPHPYFVCSRGARFLSQKYFPKAKERAVFHHKAHAANFGIEAGFKKKFIGLAFDGTGFGQDGRIWGSEFFIYRPGCFQRAAHFAQLSLPGNEAAIREPWRVGFGVLYKIYGKRIFKMRCGFLKDIGGDSVRLVAVMLDRNINTSYATSAGRLFDAAAALCNIKTVVVKEAEAAIALEKAARRAPGSAASYPFEIRREEGLLCVDFSKMFPEILSDARKKTGRHVAARRFHLTVAVAIGRVLRILRQEHRINSVYCAGGVFMNDILTQDLDRILKEDGFEVLFAKRPTTTDLGIAQGQIAACVMERICV